MFYIKRTANFEKYIVGRTYEPDTIVPIWFEFNGSNHIVKLSRTFISQCEALTKFLEYKEKEAERITHIARTLNKSVSELPTMNYSIKIPFDYVSFKVVESMDRHRQTLVSNVFSFYSLAKFLINIELVMVLEEFLREEIHYDPYGKVGSLERSYLSHGGYQELLFHEKLRLTETELDMVFCIPENILQTKIDKFVVLIYHNRFNLTDQHVSSLAIIVRKLFSVLSPLHIQLLVQTEVPKIMQLMFADDYELHEQCDPRPFITYFDFFQTDDDDENLSPLTAQEWDDLGPPFRMVAKLRRKQKEIAFPVVYRLSYKGFALIHRAYSKAAEDVYRRRIYNAPLPTDESGTEWD